MNNIYKIIQDTTFDSLKKYNPPEPSLTLNVVVELERQVNGLIIDRIIEELENIRLRPEPYTAREEADRYIVMRLIALKGEKEV